MKHWGRRSRLVGGTEQSWRRFVVRAAAVNEDLRVLAPDPTDNQETS